MKNNKRKIKILAAVLTATLLLTACGGASTGEGNTTPAGTGEKTRLEEIKERGKLIVGTEGTYSPNSFHDEDGNLVGFRLNLVDKETLENESIDTTEAIGFKVKSIVTNLSDSDFNAPAFAIDITGLVKFFLSFFMG